jgi:hypothetical protein
MERAALAALQDREVHTVYDILWAAGLCSEDEYGIIVRHSTYVSMLRALRRLVERGQITCFKRGGYFFGMHERYIGDGTARDTFLLAELVTKDKGLGYWEEHSYRKRPHVQCYVVRD